MNIMELIEAEVDNLRSFIVLEFKDDRARSLALTKLDECEMWLSRSIEKSETL